MPPVFPDLFCSVHSNHNRRIHIVYHDSTQQDYLAIPSVKLRLVDLPTTLFRNHLLGIVQYRFELGKGDAATLQSSLCMV